MKITVENLIVLCTKVRQETKIIIYSGASDISTYRGFLDLFNIKPIELVAQVLWFSLSVKENLIEIGI